MKKEKKKSAEYTTATATWVAVSDPLFYVECPHCKNTIFMSSPKVIERMKRWARKLLK